LSPFEIDRWPDVFPLTGSLTAAIEASALHLENVGKNLVAGEMP
jgi:hypothetical protein